ncbi:DUF5947 family protein [Streptomyces sp. RB6PN25]|uniref:DUF5947 family protein n=1 Tax=Streptomyces humicola TaxID=2953240 RepID=A0ABT1PNU1_9ACTN|nr:DUF5947 family protein [Streptomyces humicola]MCQ4079339.1 DUF5947 family protein [Streptomyces humicola]
MSTRQETPVLGITRLRRFLAPAPAEPERCELCGQRLTEDHRHVVDTEHRALACACTPCALLFATPGAGHGRFRTVPDRCLADPSDQGLRDDVWERLQIPVSVAFFFRNAALDRLVAIYPSPAGPTESELDPAVWQSVLGDNTLARLLEPDVEALLVHRDGDRTECFLVPIDDCYELIGRMRLHWKGFDGGAAARADLATFFHDLRQQARTPGKDERP